MTNYEKFRPSCTSSVSSESNLHVCRSKSRAVRKLNLEDNSQTFSISSLTQKSMEDSNVSLQVGVQDFVSALIFEII